MTRDKPLAYACVLLIPVVGFVLGVIAAAHRRTGHGVALMAGSIVTGALWALVTVDLLTPDMECSRRYTGLCRPVAERLNTEYVGMAMLAAGLVLLTAHVARRR